MPPLPPLLQDNLARLEVGPGCRLRLEQGDPGRIRLEPTGDEPPNQIIADTGPAYPPDQPRQRADAEARQLAAGQNPDVVAFFGLGLGFHLSSLRQLTRAPIVVFEPDADLARAVLARVDLDLPGVQLTLEPEAFLDAVGSLLQTHGKNLLAGALPSARSAHPAAFDRFRQAMQNGLQQLDVDLVTRLEFSAIWVNNLASNLPALGALKSASCLDGCLRGRPAIFIGAGPSLDLNLAALREARGKALLVAAHTAAIPLSRAGLRPDMVVIIEGQKLEHFFAGVDHLDEMTLVASAQTHPVHLRLPFARHLIASLEGNAHSDWRQAVSGEEPLPSGGSVACATYAMLHRMGCDPIICVGMDLSYSLGRGHALGTDLGCCRVETDAAVGMTRTRCAKGYHRDLEYPTTMVTGWGGDHQVAARASWSTFRHWFEKAARTWLQGTTLINANGAGARIRGFSEQPLAEVLRNLPDEGGCGALITAAVESAPSPDGPALAKVVAAELDTIRRAGKLAGQAHQQAGRAIATLRKGRLHGVQPQLDKVARLENDVRQGTRQTRLLNTLVGHRARSLASPPTQGDKVAMTIASLEQSRAIMTLVREGAAELQELFTPALAALEEGRWPWDDPRQPQPVIAIGGTGNFARNLSALLESQGFHIGLYVDSFRGEDFLGRPVLRAEALSADRIAAIDKWVLAISTAEHARAMAARLTDQGVPANRILPLSDDPDLQILRLLLEREGSAAAHRFAAPGVTRLGQLESRFLEDDIRKTMAGRDADRPTIGLGYFGRGGGFRGHIADLIPLLEPHHNVVSLSDEIMGGRLEAKRHIYLSATRACRLEGLDLMLSAHVFPCSPPDVPRVSFSHVIHDFNLTAEYHAARLAHSRVHYLFASSRPCLRWYQQLVHRFGLKNRIAIIPGGYLKLDGNRRRIAGMGGPRRAILYAPTLGLADYPHRELVSSLGAAPDILRALLAAFPDREIIFRPHPSDLKLHQLGRKDERAGPLAEALTLCHEVETCTLDDDATSYLAGYGRAGLLVSDTSSTAFTFAMTTDRPVVFYSPHEKRVQEALGGQTDFLQDRNQVGAVVTRLDELVTAASKLLDEPALAGLARFREQTLFNLDGAAEYFVRHLDLMLNREKHPDWVTFNW